MYFLYPKYKVRAMYSLQCVKLLFTLTDPPDLRKPCLGRFDQDVNRHVPDNEDFYPRTLPKYILPLGRRTRDYQFPQFCFL